MVEAVGKVAAGAAGVAQVLGAVQRQPVRVAIASAPTAGTRWPIKLDSLVINSSAPSAARL